MLGKRLAHYTVVEALGRGGMGEVYVAEDEKLGRKVALKLLPPLFAENAMLRARFEREAKVIASLSHPNIVHVYTVEEVEGVRFYTMELVRGTTLTEVLASEPLPLARFFDVAIPLVDAVAAAHAEGVIHRDLKPDNVMVGTDGRVKVLDFGLAKIEAALVASETSTLDRSEMQAQTREGHVLGSLSYMSPEQAEGKPVDTRSDIFSLGIVFFQALTGERPFRGDSPASILSSVIKDTAPEVDALAPDVPHALARIVRRCLVKDPDRRYQSARDLRNDLEDLARELVSGDGGELPPRGRSLVLPTAVVAVGLLAAAAAYRLLQPATSRPVLANPVQVTTDIGLEDYPTWSPEGGRLAYFSNQSGNFDVWVTQANGGAAVNLTEESKGAEFFPSWSPDGSQIAYAAYGDESEGGGCHVIAALGGPPRRVAVGSFVWARPSWSPDARSLACGGFDGTSRQWIQIVDLASLDATRVDVSAQYEPVDLAWSPDGRFIAYVDASNYTADVTRLVLLRLSDGEIIPFTEGLTAVWSPSFSPDSLTLWYVSNRGGSMDVWRQPIASDGAPLGEPEPVTTGLDSRAASLFVDGKRVAYSRGRRIANVWRASLDSDRPVTWADAEPITFDQAFIEFLDVSPDGTELVVNSNRGGSVDLWKLPSSGGTMQQLTRDRAPDWAPRWSPDGEEVVFYRYEDRERHLWVMPVAGGPVRQLTSGDGAAALPSWSPDGRRIAYVSVREGNFDIYVIDSDGGSPSALASGPYEESQPRWSGDGDWILFVSNRDGAYRLWRAPSGGGPPELLSDQEAGSPVIAPDGDTVLFNGLDNNVWALSLTDRSTRKLTDLADKRGELGFYSLATDGEYVYFTWVEDRADIWVMDVALP